MKTEWLGWKYTATRPFAILTFGVSQKAWLINHQAACHLFDNDAILIDIVVMSWPGFCYHEYRMSWQISVCQFGFEWGTVIHSLRSTWPNKYKVLQEVCKIISGQRASQDKSEISFFLQQETHHNFSNFYILLSNVHLFILACPKFSDTTCAQFNSVHLLQKENSRKEYTFFIGERRPERAIEWDWSYSRYLAWQLFPSNKHASMLNSGQYQ